jgi:hypothetical protein
MKNIYFKSERDKLLKWIYFNKCDTILINFIEHNVAREAVKN